MTATAQASRKTALKASSTKRKTAASPKLTSTRRTRQAVATTAKKPVRKAATVKPFIETPSRVYKRVQEAAVSTEAAVTTPVAVVLGLILAVLLVWTGFAFGWMLRS